MITCCRVTEVQQVVGGWRVGLLRKTTISDMTLVEIDVGNGSLVVRVPARAWSHTWRDTISIRDGKTIVGIGDQASVTEPLAASGTVPQVVTRSALAAHDFNASVAAAMARYVAIRARHDAKLGWWSGWFLSSNLRLRHPDWHDIPRPDRLAFLVELSRWAPRVEVNGSVKVRPLVDVPIIRALIGRKRISDDA